MRQLNSLFVPVNASASSQFAVHYAGRIALRERSSVTFSHAIANASDLMLPSSGHRSSVGRLAELRRSARTLLEGMQADALRSSVPARVLELGTPAPAAIVHAAERRTSSAIVVGCEPAPSHGSLVGNLAEDILRLSYRPVFLVSKKAADALPPSSIVVGFDGTAPSIAALDFALDLAEAGGARVIALHVLSPNVSNAATRQPQRVLDHAIRHASRRGATIEAALARGRVVAELAASVKALDADLLVVGTDGPSALRGISVGSVAKFASKAANVPVAVVRSAAKSR